MLVNMAAIRITTLNEGRISHDEPAAFSHYDAIISDSEADLVEGLGFGDAEKALCVSMGWRTAEEL